MKDLKIVGFTGAMGCGKSEAIKALAQATDRPITLVKFAQPLYDMQEYIYGRIASVHTRPETFVKDRKLLQWVGTEWGRDSISKTLWVDIWTAAVGEALKRDPRALVVCDDVRFDNEGERFNELGGLVIKINTIRNHERIDTKAGLVNHSSEAGLDPRYIGRFIDNNDSLSQYQRKLKDLFNELSLNQEK